MMWFAASAFVVVLWGLSTAVIFYLDSLKPSTFPISMAAATLVLVLAGVVIWELRESTSLAALYASFAAGLLAWGWTEMALYMGYVTGPRKQRCQHGCHGAAHFGHAVQANLWHELVVILFAVLIWWTGNTAATHCFILLWLMHLSARLNVFLGVRNVSAEFVPDHMDVLKGFLRKRNMNTLFPFSCLVLVALIVWLAQKNQTPDVVMATTLAAIGLLEHVLLMLPLPVERLWTWALSRTSRAPVNTSTPPTDNQSKTNLHLLGVQS
jgi:putative photosynthetic complex assembly protein 2